MAAPPSLSPSKITTYLACPTKYRWTYVDSRGRLYLKSKSYFSFGTSLHKALQRFHDSQDQGVSTIEEAKAALEESWIDAGYANAEEMSEALAEGKEILSSYVEQVLTAPVTAKTLYLEKTFRTTLDGFVLLGRLDRVDEWDDGSLEILDYKTGRSGVTSDEAAQDLALNVYQLLLKKHHPERAVCASIIAVRSGEKGTFSLTDQELSDLESDLNSLGKEILNRDYENLRPKPKSLCPQCDFLALCKRDPDFAEAYGFDSAPSAL